MNIVHKIVNYFKESHLEMKKVIWPTKQETTKHTLLVIGVSLAIAIFIGIFDYVFTKVFELLIK
jgi:preprotein translocase subunit SecE